ncbi:MAG: hypothetical protein KAU24_00875, partial [Candidatus Aenigmarchaeota archaeon]|nr:hypothetical protein [Candidatus Aenigmarchaeota archaeon]
MKITYVMLVLFAFFVFFGSAGSAYAAVLDVSVGTDSVIYKPGDNVIVSGVLRNAATRQPIQGATAVIAVRKGGSTVTSQSKSSDIDGKYESDPFIVSSAGTYSVSVTATHPSHTSNSVVGSFTVESEKRYTLTTDRYTYSVNDTVTTILLVESVTATGTTPASSVTVPVKFKLINGTVVKKQTVTTNSNGLATVSYQVQD